MNQENSIPEEKKIVQKSTEEQAKIAAQASENNEGWEEEGETDIVYWNPESPGEKLIGVVARVNDGDFGRQLVVVNKEGKEVMTPSHKYLVARIQKITEGQLVKITFEREEPPSQKGYKPMRVYKVESKKV